jgi:hypothetical protein
MLTLLSLLLSAAAGELIVHAEVPTELAIDGQPTAQLFRPGRLHVQAPDGDRRVTVLVNGTATHLRLVVGGAPTHLVVGRTGITTRTQPADEQPDGIALVELRAVGREGVRLTVGEHRFRLAPGDQQVIELPTGRYPAELRSGNGLAIFASGVLDVRGVGPIVVQVSEGRAPEVIGSGSAWRPTDK